MDGETIRSRDIGPTGENGMPDSGISSGTSYGDRPWMSSENPVVASEVGVRLDKALQQNIFCDVPTYEQ